LVFELHQLVDRHWLQVHFRPPERSVLATERSYLRDVCKARI